MPTEHTMSVFEQIERARDQSCSVGLKFALTVAGPRTLLADSPVADPAAFVMTVWYFDPSFAGSASRTIAETVRRAFASLPYDAIASCAAQAPC